MRVLMVGFCSPVRVLSRAQQKNYRTYKERIKIKIDYKIAKKSFCLLLPLRIWRRQQYPKRGGAHVLWLEDYET